MENKTFNIISIWGKAQKYFFLLLFIFVILGGYSQSKIRIACVGNSITYGAKVENREVNSYPAQLSKSTISRKSAKPTTDQTWITVPVSSKAFMFYRVTGQATRAGMETLFARHGIRVPISVSHGKPKMLGHSPGFCLTPAVIHPILSQ